jgi:hypothetical protein
MSTSTRELLLIHHRYPLLAFLLAICNPSTVLSGLNSIQDPKSVQNARHMLQSKRSEGYQIMIDRFFTIRLRGSDKKFKTPDFVYDLVLHLITICIAAIIIWQTVLLGIRGVIVFACWTWHEPFTWVGVGVLNHLLSTIAWRLCLGPINSSQPWPRWCWILCRSGGNLTLAHPRLARCFDMLFQILGLMNYGYGTVMLSGTTLVAPPMALQVFCLTGFASLSSRLVVLWVVQVWPEEPIEKEGLIGNLQAIEGESGIALLGVQGKEEPQK